MTELKGYIQEVKGWVSDAQGKTKKLETEVKREIQEVKGQIRLAIEMSPQPGRNNRGKDLVGAAISSRRFVK